MQTQPTPTPSISETLAAEVAKAIERGEDPLGDNDGFDVVGEDNGDETTTTAASTATDATGDETAQAAAGATDDTGATKTEGEGDDKSGADEKLDADALAAVAADDREPELLEVSKKDFKAERAKLAEQEDDLEAKWSKGDLTDAERATELRKLRNADSELLREETRAQTIADMNQQNVGRYQLRVLTDLANESKAAGQLDYTDGKVGAAFDAMLTAVVADPDNAGKSFQQLARRAHDALCAARGVKAAPAATPAAAPVAPERKAPKAPTTLRNLPAAATSQTGGNAIDALNGLSGQAYQDAFNRLSPAQRASLLDEQ